MVVGMDAKQISVCVIFELSMHRCKCYGMPKVLTQVELAIDQRGSWIWENFWTWALAESFSCKGYGPTMRWALVQWALSLDLTELYRSVDFGLMNIFFYLFTHSTYCKAWSQVFKGTSNIMIIRQESTTFSFGLLNLDLLGLMFSQLTGYFTPKSNPSIFSEPLGMFCTVGCFYWRCFRKLYFGECDVCLVVF